jgi:xanthine dehydrogenase molybdenum-binding subunit
VHGYVKIVDAVDLAAGAGAASPFRQVDRTGRVGSRTARYQGIELASGDKPYINDLKRASNAARGDPVLRPPSCEGSEIDTSKAEAHSGVVAVVTRRDVPGSGRRA